MNGGLTNGAVSGDDLAYLRHADAQGEAAEKAWRKHVAGLSEEDRRAYEAKGLIQPAGKKPVKKKRVWKRAEPDEERACFRDQRSDDPDPAAALMAKEERPSTAPLVATRFILAAIIDAPRPRLEASLIAVALEIGELQGINPQTLVNHYAVTAKEIQKRVRAWQVQLGVARVDLTLPRYVVSHVLDDPRPRLQADCFSLAFGFPLRQGMSERQLAKCYGLTVATLSARVLWWVEQLSARLPGVCKKRTAAYADSNVRRTPDNPFKPSNKP